ncbi:DUF397 domain-containing protein [Streptomyces sp. NPDC005480]|uniref:DUF397 domain-containing protein n=1 Tax=Streptomyces sp. NPDC005480 TaxID=3154880 RepID=UPI0033B58683
MNTELVWFKSSYSGSEGEACVEIAVPNDATAVHVRDSKRDPAARALTISPIPWAIFIGDIAAGGTGA